jgi:hypothetical protein
MSKHTGQQSNPAEAIKRTTLRKSDVPGTNDETAFGIAPNAYFASHTHQGSQSGHLMESSLTHNAEGQPTRETIAGHSVSYWPVCRIAGAPAPMA